MLEVSGTSQPLTTLPAGAWGVVAALRIPEEEKDRLQELGLVAGTPIELVRYAPLGDPVEIKVRGSYLTLRKHEAEQVLVVPRVA
jgi:ferrous iron transport protein A